MEEVILTSLWIISFLILLLSIIHKYLTWNFHYFLDQSIPGPDPIPLFGNWYGIWRKKWHETELERYAKYGSLYGTFDGRVPNITIGDPKLIRKVLISDFEYFQDRKPFYFNQKYLNNMVGTLNGFKWKTVRGSLTSAFSSARLKQMTPLISDSAKSMVEYLNTTIDARARKVDIKRISVAYTLDLIANCGFGCKLDCLTNPNESLFVKHALNLFSSHKFNGPIFILFQLFPTLFKLIPSTMFKDFDYFSNLAKKMLNDRKVENFNSKGSETKRNDFLDFLIEKSMDINGPFYNNEILQVAQALQFLVAGFESSATVLSNCINFLALEEEMQEKIRDEIKKNLGSSNINSIDSETIGKLTYLNQCVLETLRICPPAIRDPMTFLPFGEGPRICLASNLGLLEVKIAICYLLLNFRFSRVYETADPPSFISSPFPFLQTSKVIVGINKLKW